MSHTPLIITSEAGLKWVPYRAAKPPRPTRVVNVEIVLRTLVLCAHTAPVRSKTPSVFNLPIITYVFGLVLTVPNVFALKRTFCARNKPVSIIKAHCNNMKD